jgi:hypothetical protein
MSNRTALLESRCSGVQYARDMVSSENRKTIHKNHTLEIMSLDRHIFRSI